MGVVLRGSLTRFKMSWYGWGINVLLRRKCMHVCE